MMNKRLSAMCKSHKTSQSVFHLVRVPVSSSYCGPFRGSPFPLSALTFSLPLDLTCLLRLLLNRRPVSHVQTRQCSSGREYSSAISSWLDSSSFPASEAGEIAGTSARSKGYNRCLLLDSRKLFVFHCCLQGCS